MLKVDQYDLIRTSYRVYGKQIKQIARETGHSKNTIKKVLRGEHTDYKARDRQPFPVLEPFLDIIDGWLLADKDRPKKQRHTAVRVYQRLKTELDFTGAETTVRRYVRQAKQRLGLNGRIGGFLGSGQANLLWSFHFSPTNSRFGRLFHCFQYRKEQNRKPALPEVETIYPIPMISVPIPAHPLVLVCFE